MYMLSALHDREAMLRGIAITSSPMCINVQAYPLYFTIGLGCAGAALYLGRLALGPDTK